MSKQVCKEGDRIKLIKMDFDPDPIVPGSMGTVVRVQDVGKYIGTIITVDWDDGRSLNLIEGTDEYEVVKKPLLGKIRGKISERVSS